IYEAEELARVRAIGGCETFFNLTATKALAGKAWCNDVLMPMGGVSFGIEATPVADLPEEVTQGLVKEVLERFEQEIMQRAEELARQEATMQMASAGGMDAQGVSPALAGQMAPGAGAAAVGGAVPGAGMAAPDA